MLTDLGGVLTHLGNAWDAIKVLDTSTAIDETLAAEQLLEGIVGRWSLYFFLAVVALGAAGGALPSSFIGTLAGAILGVGVGAPAGTATGGLAGALAGATAGAAFAESVGIALLVEASVAQVAIVTKAILDLSRGAQTDEEKQKDWASIGGAAMSLAIFAVMFLIGAGAQRVAAALVKRVGPKLQRWVAKASRETKETARVQQVAELDVPVPAKPEPPRASADAPPGSTEPEPAVPPSPATEAPPKTRQRSDDASEEPSALDVRTAVLAAKPIVEANDATDTAIPALRFELLVLLKPLFPFIKAFEAAPRGGGLWDIYLVASPGHYVSGYHIESTRQRMAERSQRIGAEHGEAFARGLGLVDAQTSSGKSWYDPFDSKFSTGPGFDDVMMEPGNPPSLVILEYKGGGSKITDELTPDWVRTRIDRLRTADPTGHLGLKEWADELQMAWSQGRLKVLGLETPLDRSTAEPLATVAAVPLALLP
jgi:hypothetical protein